jgi:transcriptional regulator with XRE-family HTH domain
VTGVTTIGNTLAGATTVSTPSLRYWRTKAALEQSELAKRAGVGAMSVRRGEAGRPLQLATVRKLAEALNVTPAQLQAPAPTSQE